MQSQHRIALEKTLMINAVIMVFLLTYCLMACSSNPSSLPTTLTLVSSLPTYTVTPPHTPVPSVTSTNTPCPTLVPPPEIENIQLPLADNRTLTETAEIIFDQWLSQFQFRPPTPYWKIESYEIEKVWLLGPLSDPIYVGLSFSVKLAENSMAFVGGNGIPEEDGWIRHKYLCFQFVEEDGFCKLRGGWTLC
jgi:hypothetical protein